MVAPVVRLRTPEEKVVYYAISLTWLWYALGALYIVAPAIAWLLLALAVWRWLTLDPADVAYPKPIPFSVWVWISCMLLMQIALVVGHANFDLSAAQTIKSSIGWMKGWALFAIFPLIGACLSIRMEVIARACGLVALNTLALVPLMAIAPSIGLPGTLYVSPLQIVGGPGPEFFEVQLYGRDPAEGVRWRFFTPWAPAAAVAYGMLLMLALRDRSMYIKVGAVIATIAVAIMCKSRLGFVAIPVAVLLTVLIAKAHRPWLMFVSGIVLALLLFVGDQIIDLVITQKEHMDQMRADSSYVRRKLAQIALQRWSSEAPIFGHGIVERGPHLVEFMPIGSHHSWYGLLFVKGIVGFFALLIPLCATLIELAFKSMSSRTAQTALGFMLLFTFFTFTENVEILAYLMWPGVIVVGLAASQRFVSPFRAFLGARDATDRSLLQESATSTR